MDSIGVCSQQYATECDRDNMFAVAKTNSNDLDNML